mgnify:CR=1 FL=1
MLGMDFGACCIKNDYIPSLLICIIGGDFDGRGGGIIGLGIFMWDGIYKY